MKRSQLAHILRSACQVTGDPDILVIGSQAILGKFSHVALAVRSAEASGDGDTAHVRVALEPALAEGANGANEGHHGRARESDEVSSRRHYAPDPSHLQWCTRLPCDGFALFDVR